MKNKKPEIPAFTKEQLLSSGLFEGRTDLLTAVLSDGDVYTVAEAEAEMTKYLKRKVG